MTIHLHTTHYLQSGLSLIDYLFLLFYEQKNDWPARELGILLGVSERTAVRMRMTLVDTGYLVQGKTKWTYFLTDKLYPLRKTTKQHAKI